MKNLPADFVDRIVKQFPNEHSVFLSAISNPVEHSVHVNPKCSLALDFLKDSVAWWRGGYYLKQRPSYISDPLFHAGVYYPQESSSMIIGAIVSRLIEGKSDLRCLDVCAAPGGKSILLSETIGKNGFLVSNEINKLRNSVLRENLVKWGAQNVMVSCNSSHDFLGVSSFFDLVLVDAPCSGEGMFRKDDVAIQEWSTHNVALCAERQKEILGNISGSIRKDGYLIYSTCTFAPEENEGAIDWLLENGFESVEVNLNSFEGLTSIDYRGVQTFRFYPHKSRGEGFFVAVLKKIEQADIKRKKVHDVLKYKRLNNLDELKPNVRSVVGSCIQLDEGKVFELPCSIEDFKLLNSSLYFSMPGIELGEMKKNDFVPGHGGLMCGRFGLENSLELDVSDALKYLKREDFQKEAPTLGWVPVVFKGYPLGWIKNLGNRKNNYYPKDWRIRYLES